MEHDGYAPRGDSEMIVGNGVAVNDERRSTARKRDQAVMWASRWAAISGGSRWGSAPTKRGGGPGDERVRRRGRRGGGISDDELGTGVRRPGFGAEESATPSCGGEGIGDEWRHKRGHVCERKKMGARDFF